MGDFHAGATHFGRDIPLCRSTPRGFTVRPVVKKGGASDSAGASCHGHAGQGQGDRTPEKSRRPHLHGRASWSDLSVAAERRRDRGFAYGVPNPSPSKQVGRSTNGPTPQTRVYRLPQPPTGFGPRQSQIETASFRRIRRLFAFAMTAAFCGVRRPVGQEMTGSGMIRRRADSPARSPPVPSAAAVEPQLFDCPCRRFTPSGGVP
jgi:hypothetical protein